MKLYINFYFDSITYNDDYYAGRFRSLDNEVVCDFMYDRNNGECTISNSNRLPEEILPLPIWWLDTKLKENGNLNSTESRICY